MAMQNAIDGKLDRQRVVPFHLKLFYRVGGFHNLSEFPTSTSTAQLPPHVQIYTWSSCNLRELSHLLVSALPSLIPNPAIGTRLTFRLLYPEPPSRNIRHGGGTGRYLVKDFGEIVVATPDESTEKQLHSRASGPNAPQSHRSRSNSPTGGNSDSIGRMPSPDEQIVIGQEGVMTGSLAGQPGKTLQDARFVIGDYIEVAISPPRADGSVAPALPTAYENHPGPSYLNGRLAPPRDVRLREDGFRNSHARGFHTGGSGRGVPAGDWRRGEQLPTRSGGEGGMRGDGYRGRGRFRN